MQSVNEVVHRNYQLIPTGKNKLKTTGTTDTATKYDNDHLYEMLGDVVDTDPNWRKWYCREFYRLGKDRVLQLAAIARADGKNPRRYFSHLLKANTKK